MTQTQGMFCWLAATKTGHEWEGLFSLVFHRQIRAQLGDELVARVEPQQLARLDPQYRAIHAVFYVVRHLRPAGERDILKQPGCPAAVRGSRKHKHQTAQQRRSRRHGPRGGAGRRVTRAALLCMSDPTKSALQPELMANQSTSVVSTATRPESSSSTSPGKQSHEPVTMTRKTRSWRRRLGPSSSPSRMPSMRAEKQRQKKRRTGTTSAPPEAMANAATAGAAATEPQKPRTAAEAGLKGSAAVRHGGAAGGAAGFVRA